MYEIYQNLADQLDLVDKHDNRAPRTLGCILTLCTEISKYVWYLEEEKMCCLSSYLFLNKLANLINQTKVLVIKT